MSKEETIKKYMESLEISREEAEQLWQDDQDDVIGEEGEELQAKANTVKPKAERKRRKSEPKERKVDGLKLSILSALIPTLEQFGEVVFRKTETEMDFVVNGVTYTIKLTKHKKGWERK